MKTIFAVLLLAALVGCSQGRTYQAAAEQATKDAKDIEAAALENAPCLIGLGAWSRMPDDRMRQATFVLCVPDARRFGLEIATP